MSSYKHPAFQAPKPNRDPRLSPSSATRPERDPRLSATKPTGTAGKAPGAAPEGLTSSKPVLEPKLLANGFTAEESSLIHDSLKIAGLGWYDGDGLILGKTESSEVYFRSGQSSNLRWMVMGVPILNMNMPNAVEVCLHFLAESFTLVHVMDIHYQIAINMDTDMLEFLIQLPLIEVTPAQLGELVKSFLGSLQQAIEEELKALMEELPKA